MVLLEEFKDHKMFLIYDFLQHDVCSDPYPTFMIQIFFLTIFNHNKMRLFLLWYVVVERELSGQKR